MGGHASITRVMKDRPTEMLEHREEECLAWSMKSMVASVPSGREEGKRSKVVSARSRD